MREYRYENLLNIPYEQITEITSFPDSFTIVAEGKVGHRIRLFLDNEKKFHASKKSLIDRLKYMKGGLIGMLIPNFMPTWNKAMMNGFLISNIEQSDSLYKFEFTLENRD